MSQPLEGKVALVTGASRGIGRAIVLELARQGADIAFNYLRGHKGAAQVEGEVRGLGVRCLSMRAHLGDPRQISSLFQAVGEEFGRLDILVNNAASGSSGRRWTWRRSTGTGR